MLDPVGMAAVMLSHTDLPSPLWSMLVQEIEQLPDASYTGRNTSVAAASMPFMVCPRRHTHSLT